jgi:Ca2+-binding EF-hand superfamily protein
VELSELFVRLDTDRSGFVSLGEYVDQDGVPNREETRAMYQKQFQGLDKNKDGVLTPDEM